MTRGEIRPDINLGLVNDTLGGLVYWPMIVTDGRAERTYIDRLAAFIGSSHSGGLSGNDTDDGRRPDHKARCLSAAFSMRRQTRRHDKRAVGTDNTIPCLTGGKTRQMSKPVRQKKADDQK